MTSCISSFSGDQVFANEQLLTEIFLHLPVKSLIQCKCVAKKWNYIITSPEFTRLRVPCFNPARGLFLLCSSFFSNPLHEFVSFNLQNPIQSPFHKLTFVDDPYEIITMQSCNGLLLCCSFRVNDQANKNYYVYNPTTQQFVTLPRLEGYRQMSKSVCGMKLAFDPWKSPIYKVVCIRLSDEMFPDDDLHYQVEIYSSENKKWRVVGPPFLARYDIKFMYTGVYWNGAIYWECGDNSLRFNVEQEIFEKFPMPSIGRSWDDDKEIRVVYYGESGGYLHLVQVYRREKLPFYNIYEMKRDGMEWYLKYQVNVEDVVNAFPMDWDYLTMAVLCVVRWEKEEEEAFMILHIPKMVIRYNLRDCTFYKLCKFGNNSMEENQSEDEDHEVPISLQFNRFSACQYIESLFCM